uniref:uromodulin-like n=1 Tax=Styela clava TaxID=7725 RepID=UPI00193ADD6F|nr:uromodulin-like [Styela clava]
MVPTIKYAVYILLYLSLGLQTAKCQSACNGVSCSNKGTCIENEAYSRGYWCECDEGWAGQDCKHPEPTVRCGYSDIEVVIDKGLVRELEIDDDAKYVYFGLSSASSHCRAKEEENLYKLSIQAPFSNCGTQVIQRGPGDDYTFSNTVVWNREVHNPQNMIDRELVLLDFKCIYEDTYTVTGPAILPTNNVLQFVSEKGKFEVRMRLYDDNSYTKAHEFSSSPSIMIGTNVYVQVELELIKDTQLVVTMDRCFASQSRDPADPIATKHMLVTDRCVDSRDPTVQILYNGEESEGRFKFQMFKWRWSADDVYLHCEIDICNKTFEQCAGEATNCKGSGDFRRKRDLLREGIYDPDSLTHTNKFVSNGPIKVEMQEDLLEFGASADAEDYDTSMMFLGIVLALILAAFGVIVIIIFRRRRRTKASRKKVNYAQVPQQQQQQLSSLRFTTEAF